MGFRLEKIQSMIIIAFSIIMLMYCGINETYLMGEWDDYSLPVASFFNDGNFTVTQSDAEYHKHLYPQWSDGLDRYMSLSGFTAKNGGEMTWYFPTYSILVIPMTILLRLMGLPVIYAFSFTNILLFSLSLLTVKKFLIASDKKKLLLILFLVFHPAVFYINYIGAEICIYSFLIAAFVFFSNRNYYLAALFTAIAGTMNITVMGIGLFMIAEYLYELLIKKKKHGYLIPFGCCFLPGLYPPVYNFINTGHFNLTASYDKFTTGKENLFDRFLAYVFDLNYGMLAYIPAVVILTIGFIFLAVIKKHGRYLTFVSSGILLMLAYSVMVHINSGMNGIARYNIWGSVAFIFAIVMFYDELIKNSLKGLVVFAMILGLFWTAFIVRWYGPNRGEKAASIFMTPLSVQFLEHAPGLYNPLHSTFACRTLYRDGAYDYETPIIYKSYEDETIRKVLATKDDASFLLETFSSEDASANEWWKKKIDALDEKERYISVPKKYQIR